VLCVCPARHSEYNNKKMMHLSPKKGIKGVCYQK
jgi:hypothetical protein